MWSDDVRDAWVVDTVARWLQRQVPREAEGRRNFRLVCVDPSLAEPLERRLEMNDDASRTRWFARSSSAPDAVRLRHGRPDDVSPDACIGFVLLWSEGSAEADRNAQSLADIAAFDVADILAEPESFQLPSEVAIRERLEEAAGAWSDDGVRERVRRHLVTAWDALRTALRLAPRRQGRSLRLVDSLEAWGAYLQRALVSDEEWSAWLVEQRAERLLARLGAALPALRLFAIPALASVLGVVTRPPMRPDAVKRTGEMRWDRDLEELLLENLQWASDHGALAEAIAGKRSVHEQIDQLVRQGGVKLRSSGDHAADALESFCHSGDESALELVEWKFYEDPTSRRSRSMGLAGLLIARGRSEARVDPIDRLALETEVALSAGLSPQDAEELRRVLEVHRRAREGRALLVAALTELAGGDRAEASPDLRQFIAAVAARPAHAPEDARTLAERWASVDAKEEEDDVAVAPTLLLGLARLLARQEADLEGIDEGDELSLTFVGDDRPDSLSETFKVDGSLPFLLFRFMWDSVRGAWASGAEGDDDEDEEAQESMSFAVARRRNRHVRKLGTVRLEWPAHERRARRNALGDVLRWRQAEWRNEGPLPGGERLLRLVLEQGNVHPAGGFETLDAAWASYAAELGRDPHERAPGAEVLELVAPAPPAARSWVDAWGALVHGAAHAGAADRMLRRMQDLQAEFDAALDREDMTEIRRIRTEMAALAPPASGPALSIEDARKLLRIETASIEADGQTTRLLLTAHHPLVVRLRVLSDLLLADVIRTLWSGRWPRVARDELMDFLMGWAMPEPQHAYAVQGPEPLVFDGWVSGYAVYGRLDAGRETDAQNLGLRSVRDVVRRFAALYPAAADRLRISVQSDHTGRWAWGVVSDGLATGALRADLELVTRLASREPTAFELEALASGDGLSAFEPGPDGEAPALRLKRVETSSGHAWAHLKLVVADRVPVFQASWGDDARPLDTLDSWDPRLLFYEPLPETIDYRVRVGEPPDTLSAAVSLAVARASNRETAFRETYNFDPAMTEPVLRAEQARANWLVLVSRHPAYRAVQACAGVATLLDFSSRVESGRVVHVSVSVGEDRREECVAALAQATGELLGGALVSAEVLLRRARTLAPGLALRALGSQEIALEGLLGLLLTADEVGGAGRLVLSLDQHAQLLTGSGVLADLISLTHQDGCVRVDVAEAKFTLGHVSPTAEPVRKAIRQLRSTVTRLERFGVSHPLSARTRAALVRAAVQQIHLLDRSVGEAERRSLEAIVRDIANPEIPVVLARADDAVVHVWSWSDATLDGTDSSAGPTVVLHGKASTLRRLGESMGAELAE